MNIDFSDMTKLGLSKLAVTCYTSLYNNGATTVVELTQQSGGSRGALYKTLNDLQLKGFVTSVKTTGQPTYYHAVKLAQALNNLSRYQAHVMAKLIRQERGW